MSGPLHGDEPSSRSRRWARLLSSGHTRADGSVYVWQRAAQAGHRCVAVAVPGTDYRDDDVLVLAGSEDASGFIGDNTGLVISATNIAAADLEWPYGRVSAQVAEWTARLTPGEASEWISLPGDATDGREGAVRAYSLDPDTAYLSPVYTRSRSVGDWVDDDVALAGELYVPDEPTWAVHSSRVDEYLYRHVRDLSGVRARTAAALAAGDWRLMIYVETLLDTVYHVFVAGRPEVASAAGIPAVVREAYAEVDRRLGEIVTAAGAGTLVVVLGLEPVEVQSSMRPARGGRDGAAGFYLVAGGEGASARGASIKQIAPTLLYLAGVSVEGGDDATPLEAVVSRHWQRRIVRLQVRDYGGTRIPLNADSLRRLGALSTKTPGGVEGEMPDGLATTLLE